MYIYVLVILVLKVIILFFNSSPPPFLIAIMFDVYKYIMSAQTVKLSNIYLIGSPIQLISFKRSLFNSYLLSITCNCNSLLLLLHINLICEALIAKIFSSLFYLLITFSF